jgi:thiopurine S-methyltransferase
VFAGDFFSVTPAHLGGATVLYDRAAMIALPAPMRDRYVKHLRALMPGGSRGLLVTVSYDQAKMEGPPFSVPAEEVVERYAGAKVETLEVVPASGPRFEAMQAKETVFSLGL